MIDLGQARNDNERLTLSLFLAMEQGNFLTIMAELCSEDFVWANSGLPTLHGQEAVGALFAKGGFRAEIPILAEQTHFSADVIHIASSDDAVLTERIDHHWAADGRDLMTPHIAGVVEIKRGKATALRDFYDIGCYRQAASAVQAHWTLAAHNARLGR